MCNCKGQAQEQIVPKGITPIQVVAVQPKEIDYTIEELIRIKDYISSTNKTETERQFMADFMFKQYGDIIPSYCDQNCLNRAKRQVEEMMVRLGK
jgi:hypothetical protein